LISLTLLVLINKRKGYIMIFQFVVPKYMKNFKCIASACPDSCCVGWRVTLDEKTFKLYKESKNSTLKSEFEKYIKKNRSNQSSQNFGKIVMQKDGRCPFLDEQNLCKIQKLHGEEYLSNTCYFYPRTINLVNDVFEMSATLSCPVVAKSVLLEKGGIDFDIINLDISPRFIVNRVIDQNDIRTRNSIKRYFWDIRTFCINLLKTREISFWDRLLILGFFIQKLNELFSSSERKDEVKILIDTYTRYIESGYFTEELSKVPVNYELQLKLSKEIADMRFSAGLPNQKYLDFFAKFLQGLGIVQGAENAQILQNYENAFNQYFVPFFNERQYIFENYAVNHVFKNLFPFDCNTPFESYMLLCTHLATIKLLLVGLCNYFKSDFTEDIAVNLIQSFSKTIEHNTAYLANLLQILEKNNVNTLAYMAILIRG